MRLSLVALVACAPGASRPLPGAAFSPHLAHTLAARACGDDVAFNGDTTPDVRYDFAYDQLGRLAGEVGNYTTGGTETIVFSYDNLDHETYELDTYPDNSGTAVLSVDYDTLGDLVDYTYTVSAPGNVSTQHYAMSAFSPTGQPTIEVISETNLPDAHYVLAYDELSRIVTAVSDDGSVTTYTYDDDGRTVSVDTDNGAFTGTIVYDADNYELMESWGGDNPAAVASQTTYTYDGDRLLGIQYERGTPLALIENDTLRYCVE